LFAVSEWGLTDAHICWGWPLAAALLFIAVGPAMAGFFPKLTQLFAALLSAAFPSELPQLYHALAFALIVGGIVVSARR
jgi:hypothetical protein